MVYGMKESCEHRRGLGYGKKVKYAGMEWCAQYLVCAGQG